jgi:inosose dehydratase
MASGSDFAVQSYCFRGFKQNAEVAEKVKACGLAAIELCGVHVDFGKPETFEAALQAYRKAGVKIVGIGVEGFANNPAAEKPRFEFAKKAGVKTISANFSPQSIPQSFRAAEKLADQYDVKLAIHNHGGRHWLGNAEALAWVFSQTSERIGLMLDTAWALDAGEDPVGLVEKFGTRLYGLHVKDFTFDTARRHKDVVVGTGNLNLAKLAAALKKVGFKGQTILEYEGDVENPVPALSDCVVNMNKELTHGR